MSFNFGSLAETKPVSNNSYLKPYSINDNVSIKNSEIKEGTSTTGNKWKCLAITFGNDEGTYTESIFWINSEKDFERKEMSTSNGGSRMLPSNWETTKDKMAAIGYAFFPEQFEKLKSVANKAKTFDDIANAFKKMVDGAVNKTTTSMKLVGKNSNGRVYAALPNCTGIAQANTQQKADANGVNVGDWYTWMISPFGNKLFFSAYEENQKISLEKAKPTAMPDNISTSDTKDEIDDFDFESMLND